MIQRQYLVSHMAAECPRRMVSCQYCEVDGEYRLIDREHKELCLKFPLPCPNKCDIGSVPRQDLTEHRNMCPLEEVECSNKCGKALQRRHLTGHLETGCPLRLVNCLYCQLIGEHQFIEDQHKEQCPKFPLPYPNNCDSELKVSREDMKTHKKECPLETVQCQYQCVGCDDVMVRKHLRKHNKENMEEHLALAVSELVTLQQRLLHDVTSVKLELMEKLTETKDNFEQKLAAAEKTKDELNERFTKTERDLADSKKQLDFVKTTKDILTKKLHKTEHDLAIANQYIAKTESELKQTQQKLTRTGFELVTVKKELTTTIHNNSVAHAGFLVTEIKHKLPSIAEEVTKTLNRINSSSIIQQCKNVMNIKRRLKIEVDTLFDDLKLWMPSYRQQKFGQKVFLEQKVLLEQKVYAIKIHIERDQNLLSQNITQAEVEDLPEIYQQLDDKLHIKCINELLLQLDTLTKELTIYGENDVIETLNVAKTDTMKHKEEIVKELTQKREYIKQKVEAAKDDITSMKDLLKQLSDKHDEAKEMIHKQTNVMKQNKWFTSRQTW